MAKCNRNRADQETLERHRSTGLRIKVSTPYVGRRNLTSLAAGNYKKHRRLVSNCGPVMGI